MTLKPTGEILTQENAQEVAERKLGNTRLVIRKAVPQYLGVFGAIYGQGGSGKTSLLADLYRLGKTIILDAEGGTDSVEHLSEKEDLDIVDISTYEQFESAVDSLTKNPEPYMNIVVDNLSEILDLAENKFGIIGNDSHDLSRYKLVTRDIIRKVKALRNLTRTKHVNVFIACWDADEKDNKGTLKKDLALTPALRKEMPGIITFIGHIDVGNDPNKRVLNFAPSNKSVSKFKRAKNSNAMNVPFKIPYDVDNLPLVDILNTIRKGDAWPKKYAKVSDVED